MVRSKVPFAVGEYYHVYNRGTDKRIIFKSRADSDRFFKCMTLFNVVDPVRSLHALGGMKAERDATDKPLVEIVAYCLNPNHYHLLLKEIRDGGISEYIKRLSGGYTSYFNTRHTRTGVLFQGKFKYKHVRSNDHLLHLSAYINCNYRVHKLSIEKSNGIIRSSWGEYLNLPDRKDRDICTTSLTLAQFTSVRAYKAYAENALSIILKGRYTIDDFKE
jgi:REP element-mobilizing transposase RayT